MDLRLDDISFLPQSVKTDLERNLKLFQSCNSIEPFIEEPPLHQIAVRIEVFVRENTLLGYHCTKEPSLGFFLTNGLRVLNREEHQNEFLKRNRSSFSDEELQILSNTWDAYFDKGQHDGRNGWIWFCMSAYLVIHNGNDDFFNFFGGEAIYWPLKSIPAISNKLRSIGHPVVVEVRIVPNELVLFRNFPFALNILSHYHRSVNPSAMIHSLEGGLKRNVIKNEIVSVISKQEFWRLHAHNI